MRNPKSISVSDFLLLGCVCLSHHDSLSAQQTEQSEFRPTPGISYEEALDGWLSLFDSESLYGWKKASDANWHVKEEEIRVSQGEQGLLHTTTQFDNFELKLEFKCPDTTNSGIFLRTSPRPLNPSDDCYELNIASSATHAFPTGSLVARAKCELKLPENEWHEVRVRAEGSEFEVWLDGQRALKYTNAKPTKHDDRRLLGRGFIGLQFNQGEIAFRKIRIKPLNLQPLKIDADLSDWNTNQKLESQFLVTENQELQVIGGRGQIETVKSYGDFIFSMQCKTNAIGLNSGVFFRCIPGDLLNGYESQIQNEFKANDRSRPVDCGTGGIFRQIEARWVNANDNQWFAKTIVATGPHIGVWVNGYQVTDWRTDLRGPDENPRQGRRLEKGTIILQGHDPTTDLLFKQIRVKEMAKRGR